MGSLIIKEKKKSKIIQFKNEMVSKWVFFCDIISKDNFNVITIVDIRSTYILKILISHSLITFEILAKFIDESFSKLCLLKPKVLIISTTNYNYSQNDSNLDDSDFINIKKNICINYPKHEVFSNGNNTVYNINGELKEVCQKHKLQIITTCSDYCNQVSECLNKVLFSIVSELYIQGLENISFPELTLEHQFQIFNVAVNHINTSSNIKDNKLLVNKNKFLVNKKIDNAFFAYNIYNYPYQIMSKSDNKKSMLVILANSKIVKKFVFQYKLKFSKSINKLLENFVEPPLKSTKIDHILDSKTIKSPTNLLMPESNNLPLNKMLNILTNEELIEFLENSVKKNKIDLYFTPDFVLNLLLNNKSLSDYNKRLLDNKSKIYAKLISIKKESCIIRDEVKRNQEIRKDQLKAFLKIKLNQSLGIVDKKEKDLKLKKNKIRKTSQSKFISAIFNKNFKFILDSVKSKHRFVLCRDKITHLVLKYTGLRISDLKYITIRQLQKLFDYKELKIKTSNLKILNIPVVKSAKDIIELARPFWEELKQILKKKGFNIDEDYDHDNVTESELWSNNTKLGRGLSMRYLNSRINKQLAVIEPKFKKNFTSKSYRAGVAITIGKILGIEVAKKFLNYTNISKKVSLKSEISNKELIKIYSLVHKSSTVKDFNRKNFGSISDKKIKLKINEIIWKEGLLQF